MLYKYHKKHEEHGDDCPCCSGRRQFFKTTLMATMGIMLPQQWLQAATRNARTLRFRNPNTGENMTAVYWTPDYGYIQPSLDEINLFFRDFRQDKVMPVNIDLLNILHYIQSNVGQNKELILRSGYRSPKTNTALRNRSSNVAKNSYHLKAQAADIAVKGVSGRQLALIARQLRAGGIGTGNEFIHVDSGPVREWKY